MARHLRIDVNHHKCVGTTLCVHFAAKAFALNDHGQAVVLDASTEEDEKNVLEAAEQCPAAAITVHDATTGDQLFP